MENHKNKIKSAKTKFRVRESVTRREGINTLQRSPKGPLMKFAKEMCLF